MNYNHGAPVFREIREFCFITVMNQKSAPKTPKKILSGRENFSVDNFFGAILFGNEVFG